MDRDTIIDELIKLVENWYETEKLTEVVEWGECASDLDFLIEKIADAK